MQPQKVQIISVFIEVCGEDPTSEGHSLGIGRYRIPESRDIDHGCLQGVFRRDFGEAQCNFDPAQEGCPRRRTFGFQTVRVSLPGSRICSNCTACDGFRALGFRRECTILNKGWQDSKTTRIEPERKKEKRFPTSLFNPDGNYSFLNIRVFPER